MHTEITLDVMDAVTVSLGQALRDFQAKTCSVYDTHELQRETTSRRKRQEKAAAAAKDSKQTEEPVHPSEDAQPIDAPDPKSAEGAQLNNVGTTPSQPPTMATKKRKRTTKSSRTAPQCDGSDPVMLSDRLSRLKKPLNLNTYKNHSLGDYTEAI